MERDTDVEDMKYVVKEALERNGTLDEVSVAVQMITEMQL